MVPSKLTGGVDGAGLLVFWGCSTKGLYIDPDQQGDSDFLASFDIRASKIESRCHLTSILDGQATVI
jgi:hypothetical protein